MGIVYMHHQLSDIECMLFMDFHGCRFQSGNIEKQLTECQVENEPLHNRDFVNKHALAEYRCGVWLVTANIKMWMKKTYSA